MGVGRERYFSASPMSPRVTRAILIYLILALAMTVPVAVCQSGGSDGTYIFMDLFVSTAGKVAFYGETNKLPLNLDPALGRIVSERGYFSNTTDDLTSKAGANWSLRLTIIEDYSDGLIRIYLPADATVRPPEGTLVYEDGGSLVVSFPGPFRAGRTIGLEYVLGDVVAKSIWDRALPMMILASVAAGSAWFLRKAWARIRPQHEPTGALRALDQTKMDAISPTLNDRERMVLEAIVKEGGRVSQKKLKHICDLPKSTLSRVTDELQRKGLIRKIPVGQTNELRVDERLLKGQ